MYLLFLVLDFVCLLFLPSFWIPSFLLYIISHAFIFVYLLVVVLCCCLGDIIKCRIIATCRHIT